MPFGYILFRIMCSQLSHSNWFVFLLSLQVELSIRPSTTLRALSLPNEMSNKVNFGSVACFLNIFQVLSYSPISKSIYERINTRKLTQKRFIKIVDISLFSCCVCSSDNVIDKLSKWVFFHGLPLSNGQQINKRQKCLFISSRASK